MQPQPSQAGSRPDWRNRRARPGAASAALAAEFADCIAKKDEPRLTKLIGSARRTLGDQGLREMVRSGLPQDMPDAIDPRQSVTEVCYRSDALSLHKAIFACAGDVLTHEDLAITEVVHDALSISHSFCLLPISLDHGRADWLSHAIAIEPNSYLLEVNDGDALCELHRRALITNTGINSAAAATRRVESISALLASGAISPQNGSAAENAGVEIAAQFGTFRLPGVDWGDYSIAQALAPLVELHIRHGLLNPNIELQTINGHHETLLLWCITAGNGFYAQQLLLNGADIGRTLHCAQRLNPGVADLLDVVSKVAPAAHRHHVESAVTAALMRMAIGGQELPLAAGAQPGPGLRRRGPV